MIELENLNLPPDLLTIKGGGFENPRQESGLDAESIEELAASVDKGLLHALLVWLDEAEGCYVVLDGQRRLLAIQHLIEKNPEHHYVDGIACRLVRAATLEEARVIALSTALHRRDISTYETARTLSQLTGTVTEIAAKIHRSVGYVSLLLTAWGASEEVRERWRKGEINHRQAFAEARGKAPPENMLDDTVPDRAERPGLKAVRSELQQLYAALDKSNGMRRQVIKGRIQALEWVGYGKTMEE